MTRGATGSTWVKPVPQDAGTAYGVAGSSWSSGYHTGLDFPAPTGQVVVACAPGRVTYAGDTGGPYGIQVKVLHRPGLETWYCHLSGLSVARGAIVGAGTPLGLVGETGNTTGPHLHLEVRREGMHTNPAAYLAGAVDPGNVSTATMPAGAGGVLDAGLVDGIPTPAGLVESVRGVVLLAAFVAGGAALVLAGAVLVSQPAIKRAQREVAGALSIVPAGRAGAALKG